MPRLLLSSLLLLLALLPACAEPAAPPSTCAPAVARSAGELLIAGSGAALAPLARLLERYHRLEKGARLRLAASIGTSGALRALRDGEIDLGLSARPLRPEELSGLRHLPLARISLIFAASPRTVLPSQDGLQLARAIYTGELRRWPDGRPIVPLVRQVDDATMQVLATADRPLGEALRLARKRVGAIVCYSDQQMRSALLTIPGAFGFLDAGTIALGSLPLVRPAPGMLAVQLELGLLHRASLPRELERFIAFVRQDVSQLAPFGYRPVASQGP